jgi:hypothetical protein
MFIILEAARREAKLRPIFSHDDLVSVAQTFLPNKPNIKEFVFQIAVVNVAPYHRNSLRREEGLFQLEAMVI